MGSWSCPLPPQQLLLFYDLRSAGKKRARERLPPRPRKWSSCFLTWADSWAPSWPRPRQPAASSALQNPGINTRRGECTYFTLCIFGKCCVLSLPRRPASSSSRRGLRRRGRRRSGQGSPKYKSQDILWFLWVKKALERVAIFLLQRPSPSWCPPAGRTWRPAPRSSRPWWHSCSAICENEKRRNFPRYIVWPGNRMHARTCPFLFFLPRRVTRQKTISTMKGPILDSFFCPLDQISLESVVLFLFFLCRSLDMGDVLSEFSSRSLPRLHEMGPGEALFCCCTLMGKGEESETNVRQRISLIRQLRF